MSLMKDSDINDSLEKMNGWKYNESSIKKTFSFDSYMDSIKFIDRLAEAAEKANHHPDMVVGWCSIEVTFTSHDMGGVTKTCVDMAKQTDAVY